MSFFRSIGIACFICLLMLGLSRVYATDYIDAKLIDRIHSQDVTKITKLLAAGANPSAVDKDGTPALSIACMDQQPRIVALLLQYNANVEAKDTSKGQSTPLIWSCVKGCRKCADLLLRSKADVNKPGADGYTALMATADFRHLECAKLLIAHGANVNSSGSHGFTALMSAVVQHDTQMVEYLVQHGANVGAVDKSGDTAQKIAERDYGDATLTAAQRDELEKVIKILKR